MEKVFLILAILISQIILIRAIKKVSNKVYRMAKKLRFRAISTISSKESKIKKTFSFSKMKSCCFLIVIEGKNIPEEKFWQKYNHGSLNGRMNFEKLKRK
jgi:hypothetical protein